MLRRTKIVATLGPATESEDQLQRLIEAGVNVVRLNFSHGDPEDHKARAQTIRSIAARLNRPVAILGDLQGPKIRIGRFQNGKIHLPDGASFNLDAGLPIDDGDETQVGLGYKDLPNDCKVGDVLLLDDGRISLEVVAIDGACIKTRAINGGELSNNKGINLQGGGLSAAALTEKDKQDILLAAELEVDYLAVSFVRRASDVEEARRLMREAGGTAAILSKIERAEVVNDRELLAEVISASDAIMVARGDLGVEIGDPELIGAQKHMINEARRLNKPVITATQMMESMIHNTQPTRAEVFDVANAVLDGTDAVMLSGETATGKRPDEVVKAMSRICLGAEKQGVEFMTERRVGKFEHVDEAIAQATMFAANHQDDIKAIVCLTKSGATPLWMSRINTRLPIFAMTRYETTERLVALYRGVEAVSFDSGTEYGAEVNGRAISVLKERGLLEVGDKIILTKGESQEIEGGTNTMQIIYVS
ncbi:pyruvate kinase [Endozoicomonas elysicola]|uniref:Pyruvate kinase n=1 Tax=Endozoicomonas elysicola TaxID=305900 RepID=A0A081KF43_9GAMM|nr:pyruvate kinase [Endozoicomonas elysicola]KEI72769.1 pyruvate kinase [Endozoicomonas elysicola]